MIIAPPKYKNLLFAILRLTYAVASDELKYQFSTFKSTKYTF